METITQKKTKHIDELHFEHQLWTSEITFFAQELTFMQKRLDEIAQKNTANDVRKQIEHFQNQFIIQKEQIDIIIHLINEHEQWLSKFAKEKPIAIEHVNFADHIVLRDKAETFKKLYLELKNDFLRFVGMWM